MYQIWLSDQGKTSQSVFINQPCGMHFDSPEAGPGSTLRIFGRNLQFDGFTPSVRLVAEGSSASLEASVLITQSDAYKLCVKLPTNLTAGKVYSVYVNNGMGETRMEKTVIATAPGRDYFNLGVGWAAKLNFYGNIYNVKTDNRLTKKATGDGTTNDQPALQAAIDRASADGGGIVYLPAGSYRLMTNSWEYLRMRDRVVIQGEGKDKTTVQFGYEVNNSHLGVAWPAGVKQAGLADLSLLNIDDSGAGSLTNMSGQGTEIFLQRVRIELNKSNWIWLANSNKLVIANSTITQGLTPNFGYRGPLQLDGCTHLVVTNNNFTYSVDGLSLNNVQDAVFDSNRVYRDGSARYPDAVTNHVLILNFAENIAVTNNLFKVINGPAQDKNDGETIIAEGGGPDRIDEESGTVSSATTTTLRDNSKNWGAYRLRPVVAIVNGKGMGQWRRLTGRQGNTLQIDKPWGIVPNSGSRYVIFNWGARNWLLKNNTMEGNRRGITLYFNATTQVAIITNTLTNSGSIDLTPAQQMSSGQQQFLPMYNNQIVCNTVSNTNGSNGVFIGVHSVQYLQTKTFGTSVIGLEVRSNTLLAGRPNIPAVVDSEFPEGYLNYLQYQPATFYVDERIPAVLGSIFENNAAINCTNAVYLNSGSYNTAVCNTRLVNVDHEINDRFLDQVDHASVSTTSCPPTPQPTGRLAASDEDEEVVKVYPNPTATKLNVRLLSKGAQLMIFSASGVLVSTNRTDSAEATLDVQSLSVGNYLLIVQPDEGPQIRHHFVKQE